MKESESEVSSEIAMSDSDTFLLATFDVDGTGSLEVKG